MTTPNQGGPDDGAHRTIEDPNTRANLAGVGGGWTSSRAAQQRHDLIARSAVTDGGSNGGSVSGEPVDEEPSPRPHSGRRRHCWVVLDGLDPMPGVIAAWERTETGTWRARVSYVLGDATGGVVTGWLPATLLRPYASTPLDDEPRTH